MMDFKRPKSNNESDFELENRDGFRLDGFEIEENEFGFKIDDISNNDEEVKDISAGLEQNDDLDIFNDNFKITTQDIEFAVIDLEKSKIETKKEWTIEDNNPGAFFIYNPTRDLSYSRIYLIDKDSNEIVWQSPIKLLDNRIVLKERKSPIVYMSTRVLFTDSIDTKNGNYEIVIEDEELEKVDFVVVDNRDKFKDIVVTKDENLSRYVSNYMFDYAPVSIDITDAEEIVNNRFTQSILIEKVEDKYTVLLNKWVLGKTVFFKDEKSIYHHGESDVLSFLETLKEKICADYDLTDEEYNSISKALILDDQKSKDMISDIKDESIVIANREDITKSLANEGIVILDIYDNSLRLLFKDQNNNLVNIQTKSLGASITTDMNEIISITNLFDKEIVLTGKKVKFEDEVSLEFKSLSQIIVR